MKPEVAELFLEGHSVLAQEGHDEFQFGHLSVIDRNRGEVWLKRGDRGLAGVGMDDLVAVSLDGRQVAGTGPVHSEIWLHLGIYAARPDVGCVVHSHSQPVVALSAAEAQWPVIDQYSAELSVGMRYYDRSGLIVTPELGASLAGALGDGRTCILRCHGALVADESVEAAVVGMVELKRAVEIQLMARCLGSLRSMPETDLVPMRQRFSQQKASRVGRMWSHLATAGSGEQPSSS